MPDLARIGNDEKIWRYLPYGKIANEEDMRRFVKLLLKRAEQGTDLPFVVIHCESNLPAGCTRYLDIHPEHRNLEIGGTWYGQEFRRTKVNTESKFLLMRHAFETLGCVRVQFKTDLRNIRSQEAIERIGAVKEGILRKHIILPNGHTRDSVYYSVLSTEWSRVKTLLEKKLEKSYL